MNRLLEIIERAEVENMRINSQTKAINAGSDSVLAHQVNVMQWHLLEQENYLATAKAQIKRMIKQLEDMAQPQQNALSQVQGKQEGSNA